MALFQWLQAGRGVGDQWQDDWGLSLIDVDISQASISIVFQQYTRWSWTNAIILIILEERANFEDAVFDWCISGVPF